MRVSFEKTGIVRTTPILGELNFVLVDVGTNANSIVGTATIGTATIGMGNYVELSDENGNILIDGLDIDTDGIHGFIEEFNMMSIYNFGTITCNELIEC